MEGLACKRTRNRPIGTDQPQIKPKFPGDRQCERVASSSDQHDLDPCGMRAAQGGQIAVGNLKLWIEQRAIDISRQQPYGTSGNRRHNQF